jgi:hypothetical protein
MATRYPPSDFFDEGRNAARHRLLRVLPVAFSMISVGLLLPLRSHYVRVVALAAATLPPSSPSTHSGAHLWGSPEQHVLRER